MILHRLRLRQEREARQRQLFRPETDWKETIRSKLDGLWETNQFWNFSRCGNDDLYRTCKDCGDVEVFPYRCSLKWCPDCQWHVTARRKKVLGLWASRVAQPKHLVTTQTNFTVLTPGRIRDNSRALAKLRRSRPFCSVKGGCVSVELTNIGNGWHLHAHWLLDARWLDMEKISRAWGKLVGQHFAIVKVKDARDTDYLREVTKYLAKGSDVAKWPAELIHQYVVAIKGRRFFFPFGSLFKQGKEIRREINSVETQPRICECGSDDFRWEDEHAHVVRNLSVSLLSDEEPSEKRPSSQTSVGGGNQSNEEQRLLSGIPESRKVVSGEMPCDGVGPRH